MPYPNEHSCRIKPPSDFQQGSFRRIKRGSKTGGGARDGKQLSIIIGRPKGKTTTATQAFRYPKDDWTEAQARSHCKEEGGAFEAASKQEESEYVVVGDDVLFKEDVRELRSRLISEVIRKEGDEIILYDSEGKKVLGRFPFGEGKKYKSEEAAREAAKKRERQVQFFKHKESGYKAYTMSTNNVLISVNAIDVDGEPVPVGELVAAYEEQRGQGQGVGGPRQGDGGADVCVCPECGHEEPHEKGTLCNETKCPECGAAMVGKERTSEVDIGGVRGLLQEALAMLDAPAELAEAHLSESASGHAIALAETQAVTGGARAPLLIDVALIKPGWGNKRDNHYYSPEVLKRDAKVFEGVKMYATDHRPGEKSVRSEVSVVREITGFTDEGAPIAQVAVHDPDFAEATRNRKKLGTLKTLECSILATGRTKKGEAPDGKKGNIVEAITSAMSVDWVTKAGAGGHALNLAESDKGDVNMDKDQVKRLLSESDLSQEAQERLAGTEYESEEAVKEAILKEQAQGQEEPHKLEEAEVAKLLSGTNLPSVSKKRLTGGEYEDESALREAILAEVEYVKRLTGSGSPFAQGGGTAPGEEQMSEADYEAAYADILRRHGLHVPQQEVTNA